MAKIPKTPRAVHQDSARAMTGKIPKADRAKGSDLPPFIKPGDVGDSVGDTGVLVLTGDVRVQDSQFGTQIIADVKLNGDVYSWGIKLNSPNHRWLEDRVGSDSGKWRGKKIPVTVRENLGRAYLAIDRP